MSGHDPMDSTSSPTKGRRRTQSLRGSEKARWISELGIGVPEEYFVAEAWTPEVEKVAFRRRSSWFEKQGAKLVPVSLPHTQYAVAIYYIVAVSEASSNLARFDGVRFGVRPRAAAEASPISRTFTRKCGRVSVRRSNAGLSWALSPFRRDMPMPIITAPARCGGS